MSAETKKSAEFRVIERTWLNGKLVDEHVIAIADSFAKAAEIAGGPTHSRVRLNNSDVTVSIEPVSAADSN